MTLSHDQFSPMLPGMEHLQAVPRQPAVDAGLERRTARMMRNRARRQGKPIDDPHEIPSARNRGSGAGYPREYGAEWSHMRNTTPEVVDAYRHFGPFDTKPYTAVGVTKLYPRNEVSTFQQTVHPQRVEQIRANPAAGRGERTPGFIQGIEHAGHAFITNGNHRAMADLANGALFLPIRTVPAQSAPGLARLYRDQKKSNQKQAQGKRKARTNRQVEALTQQLLNG